MGYPSRNYRVGAYRRKNWRGIVIITLAIIVLLLLAFFIVGNILNSRGDKYNTDTKPSTSATQAAISQNIPLSYSVNGYGVNIAGYSQSDFSSAVRAISFEGVTDVSVNFTSNNGALLYSSEVAQKLGYQSVSQDLITPSAIVSSAKSRGFFVSGYMIVNSHKESDDKIAAVRRSYEAAIACELIDKGVRDVVIRVADLKSEDIDALASLGNAIKEINGEASVGIALDKEILLSENSAVYVDKLKKAYKFICLDLVNSKDDDLLEYISSSVSENLLYILRDNIRILLPSTNNETLAELKEILASNNVSNWQEVYR